MPSKEISDLKKLLDNPQPGLITWNEAFDKAVKAVLGPEPKKEILKIQDIPVTSYADIHRVMQIIMHELFYQCDQGNMNFRVQVEYSKS